MKVITHNDITNLNINPATCYEWVSYMIQNKANVLLPPKISMKPQEGVFVNVMPGIIGLDKECKYGGVKVVSRYPNRNPTLDSKMLLFDAESGETKAILDANWITSMRTGAVAAHSIKLFAKSNFKTLGFMGLGNTARATLAVLSEIFKDQSFSVKLLRYKGQENAFAERFANSKNLKFDFCDTVEEVLKGSDVVVSAITYAQNDFAKDEAYNEGILLVPIHTLGFTNCDLFFDKIFADDYGHVCHFKNFEKFKYFAEVCDVVNKKSAGRQNDKERIIAYNIGVSMHDIYFATQIYGMLQNKKTKEINFCEPKDKYYI